MMSPMLIVSSFEVCLQRNPSSRFSANHSSSRLNGLLACIFCRLVNNVHFALLYASGCHVGRENINTQKHPLSMMLPQSVGTMFFWFFLQMKTNSDQRF